MSDTTKQPAFWLFVKEERSHGYFHLHATPTKDSRECNPNERERYPYGVNDRYNGPLYSGLDASCQGDNSTQRSQARESAVYGFGRLEYRELHTVDLQTAERMVKTLKALNRKLEKLAEARGYVRSYPEFVGRFAEVIGAQGIVLLRSDRSRDITGERYEWLSLGDGINQLANRIWQWQREVLKDEQEVSA